ncbi:MAG TPA: hypothetical protein VJR90_01035 [Gammaproteobacteria bacterium]|nr:hypothetical protein [Gammaproteobacteria bacterium]
MATEGVGYREDVEQTRRRFAEFRQTHIRRARLPRELWGAAAKLARRDGIAATARVLGVDRPSLQKWTDRLEPRASKSPKFVRRQRRDQSASPAFVELLAASTATATSCVVEVESASGGKLRLDLKGIATSQLAELIRAFAAS